MDCLDKLLIVQFTEKHMFWNNTIKNYKWVCYRKGHQRRPKVYLREGSYFKDHTSLSLVLFSFFTVGHFICSIILIIIVSTVRTKHVENMWKNAKISHKARCETQRSLVSSYLQEFMWR